MVKGEGTIRIQRKVSKKRYLHGKHTYTYERLYVPIPKRFHDKVKPFLNKNLKIEVRRKNNGLEIICVPRENVSGGRNVFTDTFQSKNMLTNVNSFFSPILLQRAAW